MDSNGKWRYEWLYSCPAVLVLGAFKLHGYKGLVTLPLVYPRAIILGVKDNTLTYNDIPQYMFGDKILDICRNLSKGVLKLEGFLEKALFTTMYYGGYNLLLEHNSDIIPLSIELVNTDKFLFYYRHVKENQVVEREVSSWILLGTGLRTGYKELVLKACKVLGFEANGTCFLKIHEGELVIITKPFKNKDYVRVVPDNNPLRHVINYDIMKRNNRIE